MIGFEPRFSSIHRIVGGVDRFCSLKPLKTSNFLVSDNKTAILTHKQACAIDLRQSRRGTGSRKQMGWARVARRQATLRERIRPHLASGSATDTPIPNQSPTSAINLPHPGRASSKQHGFPQRGDKRRSGSASNNREQLHEMSARFESFDRARREFLEYLYSIGQGREGGLELLSRCREKHSAPVLMFTRKGTIDDAIACLDAEAAGVEKKPMPADALPSDPEARREVLDDALLEASDSLKDRFCTLISQNTHWAKNQALYLAITMFLLGLFVDRGDCGCSSGFVGIACKERVGATFAVGCAPKASLIARYRA